MIDRLFDSSSHPADHEQHEGNSGADDEHDDAVVSLLLILVALRSWTSGRWLNKVITDKFENFSSILQGSRIMVSVNIEWRVLMNLVFGHKFKLSSQFIIITTCRKILLLTDGRIKWILNTLISSSGIVISHANSLDISILTFFLLPWVWLVETVCNKVFNIVPPSFRVDLI